MSRERVQVLQRISRDLRKGAVMDVYKIAAEVAKDFPEVPMDRLEQIVSEEVIAAHGNAVWEKKTGTCS
jgi:hypothetical protein